MKKNCCLLLIMIMVFTLYSCSGDGSADIWIFAKSFNKISGEHMINLSEATVINFGDCKEFECFIHTSDSGDILLTLNSEKDGTISSLSVTETFGGETPTEAFCNISKAAAAALTADYGEDVNAVSGSLCLSDNEKIKKNTSTYFETEICRYSLVANDDGIVFTAELSKYLKEEDEPLTLRKDSESTRQETSERKSQETSESKSENHD